MIKFIDNTGEFFSSNYFDEDFVKKVHDKSGYAFDDQKELQKRITPLKDKYYRYKQSIIEGRLRIKDKIFETHQFHTLLLNALGMMEIIINTMSLFISLNLMCYLFVINYIEEINCICSFWKCSL